MSVIERYLCGTHRHKVVHECLSGPQVCVRCHILKSCVKPSKMNKLKIRGYTTRRNGFSSSNTSSSLGLGTFRARTISSPSRINAAPPIRPTAKGERYAALGTGDGGESGGAGEFDG